MTRLLLLLALLYPSSALAQLPVVPGAPLTSGMTTRAAYGCGTAPVVLRVTNLNDSGSGSLRAALTDNRPRVVVFETSGYITISSTLNVNNPCLTVAGQTAPSPGVTVRGNGGSTETGFYVNAKDVLFQHFRIRPGSAGCNSAVQIYGGSQERLVFDHMSVSWGQDDNVAFNWTNGQSTDTTIYRSITSEGIFSANGSEACTGGGKANGHGMLVGAAALGVSVVQTLFATNFERNPYMQGGTRVVLLNNLIYQWHGPWGIFLNNGSPDGSANGKVWYASVVGNRFIAGPKTCCTGNGDDSVAYQFVYSTNNPVGNMAGNQIYRKDNTLASPPPGIAITEQLNQYSYDPNVSSPPSQAPLPAGYTALASATLEDTLLPTIGARPTDRDGVDTRTIQNVKSRTGNYVHDISEVGGFPALAANTRAFTEPANPHGTSATGYTNLENALHAAATALEGGTAPEPPKPGPPDVAPAAGVVFVRDEFTGVLGTPLTQHQAAIGGAYTLQASSILGWQLSGQNDLLSTGVGDGTLTLAGGLPTSSQYDVAVDAVAKSLIAGHQYGVWARSQAENPLTGLAFLYDVSSTAWTLSQFTAQGFTTLGSCIRALTAGQTLRVTLRVRTGSVHAVLGDTQCTSTEAAGISAAGRVGLSTYFPGTLDSETTGVHFDNLLATDVEAGTPPAVPTRTQLLVLIGVLALIIVALVVVLLRNPEALAARRL